MAPVFVPGVIKTEKPELKRRKKVKASVVLDFFAQSGFVLIRDSVGIKYYFEKNN